LWPQGKGAVPVDGIRWKVPVSYGGNQDAGCDFENCRLWWSAHRPTNLWIDWVAQVEETGRFPPVQLPAASFVLGEAYRTV